MAMVGRPYTNELVRLTEERVDELPTILLQFHGDVVNRELANINGTLPLAGELDPAHPYDVLVAVPPSHYMEYIEDKKMYLPGFHFDEPEGSVLGANVMMLHDIYFDVEGQRIGWVESSCDYTGLVHEFLDGHVAKTGKKGLRSAPTVRVDFAAIRFPDISPDFCSSKVCRVSGVVCTVIVAFLALVKLTRPIRRRLGTKRHVSGENPTAQPLRRGVGRAKTNLGLTSFDPERGSNGDAAPSVHSRRRGVLRARSNVLHQMRPSGSFD
jgi:hypothetical protein